MRFLIKSIMLSLSLISGGCVALPQAPRTNLCVFTNTYADKNDPDVVKNPKLIGTMMPPEKHYFRCRNASSTKYNIPVTSPSANNIIGTPYTDYLDLNAYYTKLAAVFEKEVLQKVAQ